MAASASEGDDSAVRVDIQNDMSLTVWTEVTSDIKTFTLDHRIGNLTPWSIELIRTAKKGGGDWVPITDVEDDRALIRAELLDEVEAMRDAEWLPQRSGSGTTLAEMVENEGVTASTLAAQLGIAPGRARAIIRGESATTPKEDALLADWFGTTLSQSFVFDHELLAKMDSPAFRNGLSAFAKRRFDGDLQQARLRLASDSMAVAARHREPGSRNWHAIITEILSED
jgi:transcriptional regulator with XRE-family HTH domain